MILCIGATPAAQRVMVFGKLTLDEVNRATASYDGAAGKSINVAKVLKTLGEQPLAIGFLGGDRGRAILRLLQSHQIETEFLEVSTTTRQCITVLDESARTQTELVEESAPVPAHFYAGLLEIVGRRVKNSRAAVMSGTITPGGPQEFYAACTRLARAAGALAIVDAKGVLLTTALAERPGLVKPNRKELAATLGCDPLDEPALCKAMRDLAERGAERVVVTGGKQPIVAFDGRKFWKILPPTIHAVNPIGSGDAFTAGLTAHLLKGEDLAQACRWASACGAANALSLMPGELTRADVAHLAPEAQVLGL